MTVFVNSLFLFDNSNKVRCCFLFGFGKTLHLLFRYNEYLSAIVPPSDHNRTSICPANSNRNFTVDAAANTGAINIPNGGANWGVGCLYDQLDSEGEDFRNSQFTIQMTNGLTDGNPVSAYLFLKHKTTLAFNRTGVQVVN